ncbi:MAG: GTP-binding protein [Bacilli bacterium]|nr:GTP-binding protein [Bacilli bacterium]
MKSGFVSLIGKPNVGKSTIMNLLSNRKVSIVTPKAQTTRNNIISVVDAPNYQIVFTDTPGYHNAKNALGKSMNKKVGEAINSADVLILVLSAKEEINEEYLAPFLSKPVHIVVLNKIDLVRLPDANLAKSQIKNLFPKATLIEMCATDGFNADA